jgi:MFS family permease
LAYAFSLIKVGDGIFAQGWRWIFIIEGIVTILIGIAALFTLGECGLLTYHFSEPKLID